MSRGVDLDLEDFYKYLKPSTETYLTPPIDSCPPALVHPIGHHDKVAGSQNFRDKLTGNTATRKSSRMSPSSGIRPSKVLHTCSHNDFNT